MGEIVTFEVLVPNAWVEVGRIRPHDPPGSIAAKSPIGRETYLFGWIDGRPRVARSIGGIDVDASAERVVVAAQGLEILADLADGPYECCIRSDAPICARWVLSEDLVGG